MVWSSKPHAFASTRYEPGLSSGNEKCPLSSVWTVRWRPVVELATVTAAPATGALLGSVTCPAKAPVVSPCARTVPRAPEKTTARSKRATNPGGFSPHGANLKCPMYFLQRGRTNLMLTSLADVPGGALAGRRKSLLLCHSDPALREKNLGSSESSNYGDPSFVSLRTACGSSG